MDWGGFDPQPVLRGQSLALRPLSPADREALYLAAADPLIWQQHPAKSRNQRAVFDPYFDFLLSRGSALVAEDTEKNEVQVIGTSSFYLTPEHPPAASIGFTFLARSHWGGAANRQMKALMLGHLFQHFDAAWLHIAPDNIRSQRATEKLGALRQPDRVLDLGSGAARLATYRLARQDWAP